MKSKEELRVYKRIWERSKRRSCKSLEKRREYDRERNHLPHRKESKRIRAKNNKEKYNLTTKRWRLRLRLEIINHYSKGKNCCNCCGENHLEFLAVDHIGGGGATHRKEVGVGKVYAWIKRNNFPDGFQILCHNCNLSFGFYGYCPHHTNVKDNQ